MESEREGKLILLIFTLMDLGCNWESIKRICFVRSSTTIFFIVVAASCDLLRFGITEVA